MNPFETVVNIFLEAKPEPPFPEIISTRKDVQRVVAAIKLECILQQLDFGLDLFTHYDSVIQITGTVLERSTKDRVRPAWYYRPKLPISLREFMKGLREELIHIFVHEIDEGLIVNGDRIFDPHVHEKALPPR